MADTNDDPDVIAAARDLLFSAVAIYRRFLWYRILDLLAGWALIIVTGAIEHLVGRERRGACFLPDWSDDA